MDAQRSEGYNHDHAHPHSGRKKRPRVAEEKRQRATRACDGCRAVKERCQGGFPCHRCIRLERNCAYTAAENAKRHTTAAHDEGRIQSMELIVSHFLGDVPLDGPNLQRIVEKLQDRRDVPIQEQDENLAIDEENFTVKALSSSAAHYSGEFSHWNFSQRIKRKIDEQSGHANTEVSRRLRLDFMKDLIDREYWRASQLHLPGPNTQDALRCLPPRPIADFLAQVFLKYGQDNYFFVEETWLQAKLEQCYDSTSRKTVDDSAWICSVLMALAVGTQFAHLEDHATSSASRSSHTGTSDEEKSPEDNIGVTFYHAACKLIPDTVIIASVESAQAFLLLAAYLLPLDAQGLGYTYLGLAVKMCVQNGMHRKQSATTLGSACVELRRRLWWSAYALDKRISILHGRPATVAHSDADADHPTDIADFQAANRPNSFHNLSAIIKLTGYLGEIAYVINLLRRCPKTLQSEYIGRLLTLRDKMYCWWQSLPEQTACRDLSPSGSLFRPNVHLKMSLHLNQVYMGRPFLFHQPKVLSPDSSQLARDQSPHWSILANDCVDGALAIIDLCRLLQEYTGLARASYTEFSSCRAALLAIIAQSLNEQSERLRSALALGLELIRKMMIGNDSAKAEVSVIEALINATRRLTAAGGDIPEDDAGDMRLNYTSFKSWAASARGASSAGEEEPFISPGGTEVVQSGPDPFAGMTDLDLNELLASFPLEQGGFGPLPPFE